MAERDWRLERPLRTRIVFQPETGVEDRGSDFQLLDLEGRFRVRQAIGPDTQWIFGGELGIRSYEFSAGGPGDGVLYRIVPELGVAHFAREDIYVEASFLPSIRSSFEGSIGLDHVFWNFEALGTWRYQEGLMFDGGFAISDEYGGTKLIPLLGVRAQLDPNWRVDALLPRHIEISWNNLERTTLYGGWYREGADYRVKETFLSGAEEHDIFVSEIRVAAGVDYQLTDSVQGWAELGFIAGGDIEMRPGNVAGFEGGLETEPYVRVGFAWSLVNGDLGIGALALRLSPLLLRDQA
jgi:hypothetical protein